MVGPEEELPEEGLEEPEPEEGLEELEPEEGLEEGMPTASSESGQMGQSNPQIPEEEIPIMSDRSKLTSSAVLEAAGATDVMSKSLGSNNKQNVVLATINGLGNIKSPEEVAKKRGKAVAEVLA